MIADARDGLLRAVQLVQEYQETGEYTVLPDPADVALVSGLVALASNLDPDLLASTRRRNGLAVAG